MSWRPETRVKKIPLKIPLKIVKNNPIFQVNPEN